MREFGNLLGNDKGHCVKDSFVDRVPCSKGRDATHSGGLYEDVVVEKYFARPSIRLWEEFFSVSHDCWYFWIGG